MVDGDLATEERLARHDLPAVDILAEQEAGLGNEPGVAGRARIRAGNTASRTAAASFDGASASGPVTMPLPAAPTLPLPALPFTGVLEPDAPLTGNGARAARARR